MCKFSEKLRLQKNNYYFGNKSKVLRTFVKTNLRVIILLYSINSSCFAKWRNKTNKLL